MIIIIQIALLIGSAGISLMLLRNLWMKQEGSTLKKAAWSLLVWIPLIGWILYGGFFSPPESNHIKAEGGASGWKPWIK